MNAPRTTQDHIPLLSASVIERAQAGDQSAFGEIVQAYRKRVFSMLTRLVSQPEEVEDLAQEVFVRLYHSLPQLRSPELFEAWLGRITANAACDFLRRKKRSHEVRLADMAEEQARQALLAASSRNGENESYKTRIRDEVDALLRLIPVRDRILLVLKEIEGLSLKELERIYGVDTNVLKRRLFRARQRTLKAYAEERAKRPLGPSPCLASCAAARQLSVATSQAAQAP